MTKSSKTRRRLLVIGLLVIALMAPPIVLGMGGQSGLAAAFAYGGAIALGASFIDLRLAVALSLITGAAGVVAALLNPYPIAGGLFFGLLTGASALAARRGFHSAVLTVPLFLSFILAAPPQVAGQSATASAVIIGAVLTVGGLWMAGAARLLLVDGAMSSKRHPVGPRTTVIYASLMGLVLGIAAWGVLSLASSHQGAWVLLTLIIVLQPSPHDTFVLSLQRLAGTLVGGLFALLLILAGIGSTLGLLIAGVLFFCGFAVRFALKRPYWEYVSFLTPAVILMDAPGQDAMRVVEERVGYTILAVAIGVVLAIAIKALVLWKAPPEESA